MGQTLERSVSLFQYHLGLSHGMAIQMGAWRCGALHDRLRRDR